MLEHHGLGDIPFVVLYVELLPDVFLVGKEHASFDVVGGYHTVLQLLEDGNGRLHAVAYILVGAFQ